MPLIELPSFPPFTARLKKRVFRRPPVGAPPGTIETDHEVVPVTLRLIAYSEDTFVDESGGIDDLARFERLARELPVRWLDVVGVDDPEALRTLATRHGIHPLALEDVAHVHQRAKVEHYGDHDFITVRMVQRGDDDGLDSEQFSLFGHLDEDEAAQKAGLPPGWLLTFQEREGDCFGPVRDRLRNKRGRIRARGADYLAYALLDAIVDAAFPVLEVYDERLDAIEARIIAGEGQGVVADLHRVRADLLQLRRAIWPLREAMTTLVRDASLFFSDETRIYLRDCYDHTVQLLDLIDAWREIASSLMDLHISAVGQRTNEIMRVLTVISVLFMPMSFIAGLYGMNFDAQASPLNMPELRWAWGYPFALLLMLVSAAGFLFFFKRRGFLESVDGGFAKKRPR